MRTKAWQSASPYSTGPQEGLNVLQQVSFNSEDLNTGKQIDLMSAMYLAILCIRNGVGCYIEQLDGSELLRFDSLRKNVSATPEIKTAMGYFEYFLLEERKLGQGDVIDHMKRVTETGSSGEERPAAPSVDDEIPPPPRNGDRRRGR